MCVRVKTPIACTSPQASHRDYIVVTEGLIPSKDAMPWVRCKDKLKGALHNFHFEFNLTDNKM